MFEWILGYHQHRVIGMEHVPRAGAAILVHNHSLATYDNILLGAAIYLAIGRLVRGLGDRLMFRIPVFAGFMTRIGFVEANFDAARRILADGRLVGLTPGGMREALKPSTEKYQIKWHDRKGFVRLAIATQTPIILAANPRGDDIFTIFPSALTESAYRRFKLPLPVFYGRAFMPVPRPVALTHVLAAPIAPPNVAEHTPAFARAVDDFHGELIARMQTLMAEALAHSADSRRSHE